VHVETPAYAGEHMYPSRQPGWKAIDGGFVTAIYNPADAPFQVDPVKAPIFVTNVLCPNLIWGLQPSEVPYTSSGGRRYAPMR
jgi:hypothetical protein